MPQNPSGGVYLLGGVVELVGIRVVSATAAAVLVLRIIVMQVVVVAVGKFSDVVGFSGMKADFGMHRLVTRRDRGEGWEVRLRKIPRSKCR